VSIKSFGVRLMFDISNELSTKTIKRLYYYIVNRFIIFIKLRLNKNLLTWW
jgi:hypothetical protein